MNGNYSNELYDMLVQGVQKILVNVQSHSMVLVSKDLTREYVRLRKEHKSKKNRFGTSLLAGGDSGQQSLLANDGQREHVEIEMQSSLPPQWVELSDEITDDMAKIEKEIKRLRQAHERRLQQVFNEAPDAEKEVQKVTDNITTLFHRCETKLKSISHMGGSSDAENAVRKNGARKLATQLQELSSSLRQAQKKYLDNLRGREAKPVDFLSDPSMGGADPDYSFGQSQQQALEAAEVNVAARSQEIDKIASSINDLATIFKELATLVVEQGTILDRIDYNMETMVDQTVAANIQLEKAYEAQKSGRATKCIYFLLCAIGVCLFILIIRYSH
jgi:syntaxin 16